MPSSSRHAGYLRKAFASRSNEHRAGRQNVVSDGYVAGRMLLACIWSAIYNVNINTGSIKDAEFLKDAAQKIADAKSEMARFQPVLDACNLG